MAAECPSSVPPQIVAAFRDNQFRLSDLDAVMVYEAQAGDPPGWHGDVVMRRELLPLSDTLGTKTAHPCSTRVEAEAAALNSLAMIVGLAAQDDA
jgi:hypothetical protein